MKSFVYKRDDFCKFPWDLIDDSPANKVGVFGGNIHLNQVKLIRNEDNRVFVSFCRQEKIQSSEDLELIKEIWELPVLLALLIIKHLDKSRADGENSVRNSLREILKLNTLT